MNNEFNTSRVSVTHVDTDGTCRVLVPTEVGLNGAADKMQGTMTIRWSIDDGEILLIGFPEEMLDESDYDYIRGEVAAWLFLLSERATEEFMTMEYGNASNNK